MNVLSRPALLLAGFFASFSALAALLWHLFGTTGLLWALGLFLGALGLLTHHFVSLLLFNIRKHTSRTQWGALQVEAYVSLVDCLKPRRMLPATRGWAASPDYLKLLAEEILERKPNTIVEASCGVSTLICAYCLEKIGAGKVFALEHNEVFAEKTRRQLRQHGLEEWAEVLLAPLVPQPRSDGARWYDAAGLPKDRPIDLLSIDGPPKSTGPMARAPAFAVLRESFSERVVIFVDDGNRDEETKMVRAWQKLDPSFSAELLDTETGTWVLRRLKEQ